MACLTAQAESLPPSTACAPSFGPTSAMFNGSSLGTWLGADAAYSVALSPTQSFWVFGDTFLAGPGVFSRGSSAMVGNTAAVSNCVNGVFSNNFQWRINSSGVAAFFEYPDQSARFWPAQPWMAGGILYAPLQIVVNTPGVGLGFRITGNALAVVTNPSAFPSQWTGRYELLPNAPGLAMGVGAVTDRQYVYLYNTYSNDTIVGRMPIAALSSAPANPQSLLEYWSRSGSWRPGFLPGDAALTGLHANSGLTVRYLPGRGIWLALFADSSRFPMTNVSISTAPAPTGPWSTPVSIFAFPEMVPGNPSYDPQNTCYAAYEHPEFNADPENSIAFTYNCNSFDFGKLTSNLSLYFSRFVRLPLPGSLSIGKTPPPPAPTPTPPPPPSDLTALEVSSIGTLSAQNANCSGQWNALDTLFCAAASAGYCQSLGNTGGVMQEYDATNSRALVACVNGQPQQVSISELSSLVAGTCSDTYWDSSRADSGSFGLTCNSAAERYCLAQGAAGGVIQGFNTAGNSAIVLCLGGTRFGVSVSTLDALLGNSILDAYPWNDTWHGLYYNSAAGRYCRSQGYRAGVIQEWDFHGNSTVTCF